MGTRGRSVRHLGSKVELGAVGIAPVTPLGIARITSLGTAHLRPPGIACLPPLGITCLIPAICIARLPALGIARALPIGIARLPPVGIARPPPAICIARLPPLGTPRVTGLPSCTGSAPSRLGPSGDGAHRRQRRATASLHLCAIHHVDAARGGSAPDARGAGSATVVTQMTKASVRHAQTGSLALRLTLRPKSQPVLSRRTYHSVSDSVVARAEPRRPRECGCCEHVYGPAR
eukprot:scaffold11651_cov118-Isochrysis_galbana.AAC.5